MVTPGLDPTGVHGVMAQDQGHVPLSVLDEGIQEVLHGDLVVSPLEPDPRGRVQVPDQMVIQFKQKIS